MGNWLRRIRGAAGMGVTWAAAWSFVGSVPHWVFGIYTDAPLPLIFGVVGFVAGVTFSVLLVLTARHQRFDQMSLPRFAAWGAMGGLLVSTLFVRGALNWGELVAIPTTFAAACALSASGSLAIARRATRSELPAPHGEATGSGSGKTAHRLRRTD